jgi:hypothetical protein
MPPVGLLGSLKQARSSNRQLIPENLSFQHQQDLFVNSIARNSSLEECCFITTLILLLLIERHNSVIEVLLYVFALIRRRYVGIHALW